MIPMETPKQRRLLTKLFITLHKQTYDSITEGNKFTTR